MLAQHNSNHAVLRIRDDFGPDLTFLIVWVRIRIRTKKDPRSDRIWIRITVYNFANTIPVESDNIHVLKGTVSRDFRPFFNKWTPDSQAKAALSIIVPQLAEKIKQKGCAFPACISV
jgi:hypothetical protein